MKPLGLLISSVGYIVILVSQGEGSPRTYGTFGFGGGSSALWGPGSQGGLAVGGTVTRSMDGPSISMRVTAVKSFSLFDSYEESVSELAIMGGWDVLTPQLASVAVRLGLGRVSYHGGYAKAQLWDYEGHAWGPAMQFDAFWRRIGISYIIHTGGRRSFSAILVCFRFGNIGSRRLIE